MPLDRNAFVFRFVSDAASVPSRCSSFDMDMLNTKQGGIMVFSTRLQAGACSALQEGNVTWKA